MDKKYVIRTEYPTGYVFIRDFYPYRVSNIRSATHYTLEKASKKLVRLSRKYDRDFQIILDEEA